MTNPMKDMHGEGHRWLAALRRLQVGLLDFRFQHYLSMELLPFFYGLLVVGVLLFFVSINVLAFIVVPQWAWWVAGATPFALLLTLAVVRAALEFVVLAYRIMQTVSRMDEIPQQVTNLNNKVDGISERVEHFHGQIDHIQGQVNDVTHSIQFLKPISKLSRMSAKVMRKGQGD